MKFAVLFFISFVLYSFSLLLFADKLLCTCYQVGTPVSIWDYLILFLGTAGLIISRRAEK